jgi:hypothetical protein
MDKSWLWSNEKIAAPAAKGPAQINATDNPINNIFFIVSPSSD